MTLEVSANQRPRFDTTPASQHLSEYEPHALSRVPHPQCNEWQDGSWFFMYIYVHFLIHICVPLSHHAYICIIYIYRWHCFCLPFFRAWAKKKLFFFQYVKICHDKVKEKYLFLSGNFMLLHMDHIYGIPNIRLASHRPVGLKCSNLITNLIFVKMHYKDLIHFYRYIHHFKYIINGK